MAFGKKKVAASNQTQDNITTLASDALSKQRNTRIRLALRLEGEVGAMFHRWGSKAVIQLLANATGHEQARGKKDLTEQYEDSWYRNVKQQPAIPCRVLKACFVSGSKGTDGLVSGAELNRELRVMGRTALLRLPKGFKPTMDIRPARTSTGQPDMRARGWFESWALDVILDFPKTLSIDKVMAAVTSAGDIIGLGEMRPEKGGDLGIFSVTVLPKSEFARIEKENALAEDMFKIPEHLLRAADALPETKKTDKVKKVLSTVTHVNGAS
jgi:hypothetical protein